MTLYIGTCYNIYNMENKLTSDQENAKNLIIAWFINLDTQVFVLSGYAGTGKTFLLRHVVCDCLALVPGKDVAFTAPTGKAASVLIRGGVPASTIHSLIYKMDDDESETDENGEIIYRRLKFIKREELPSLKLIVVDEASMVSDEVIRDLLSYGIKVLFCGDDAQLPPVNGTSELLSRADYTLTEIMRQEMDNPIVALAKMARTGERISYGAYGKTAAVVRRAEFTGNVRRKLLLKADQVICGTNRTRSALNNEMRAYHGIDPSLPLPKDGEKLICTLNNWERCVDEEGMFNLVNGIIGFCSNVEAKSDGIALLDFRAEFLDYTVKKIPFDEGIFLDGRYYHGYGELAEKLEGGNVVSESNFAMIHNNKVTGEELISRFEFAYAITCHKAQGSEFDFVIVFDESRFFGDEAAKWLYTAVTRARKRLIIVR